MHAVYWPYSDPSRLDELLDTLTALRKRITMAKDKITEEERKALVEKGKEQSQSLFDSLKKHVEQEKKK